MSAKATQPKPPTIRQRVHQALPDHPITARELADLAGVTHMQCIGALMNLYEEERIERVGRCRYAKWRAQTIEEAIAAERRRNNARRQVEEEIQAEIAQAALRDQGLSP